MAFREKSAWIMTLALLLAGASYVQTVVTLSARAGELVSPNLPTVVGYTVVLVIIAVAGQVLAAVLAPRDAGAAPDERERLIVDRAAHLSSYVLGAGVVMSLGAYLLTRQGDLLFYTVFGSLMLSSLAEYALQIVLHRRGV